MPTWESGSYVGMTFRAGKRIKMFGTVYNRGDAIPRQVVMDTHKADRLLAMNWIRVDQWPNYENTGPKKEMSPGIRRGDGSGAPLPPKVAVSVVAGKPGAWTPAGDRRLPRSLVGARKLTSTPGADAGAPWAPGEYVEVGGSNHHIYWDGSRWMAGEVPVPPPLTVSAGAPGAWAPTGHKDTPGSLAAAVAVGQVAGAGAAWAATDYVLAGTDKVTWDGSGWVVWVPPLEITPGKPSVWVPPNHPHIPKNMNTARALGPIIGAELGASWCNGEYVDVDHIHFNWDGAAWQMGEAAVLFVTAGSPGSWSRTDCPRVPTDLAGANGLGTIAGAYAGTKWDFDQFVLVGTDKITWDGTNWIPWVLIPLAVTAGEPGAWVPATHVDVPTDLAGAVALGAMVGAAAGQAWTDYEHILAGTDEVTWDGTDWVAWVPIVFSVTPGTPGGWVPPNHRDVPADLAAAISLGYIPGADTGTPWGPKDRVLAADNAPVTWDGTAWTDWKEPLSVTHATPGAWAPAAHTDIPTDLAGAKALGALDGADAGTPWPLFEYVLAGTDKVTWDGSDWIIWVPISVVQGQPGNWLPAGDPRIPKDLAEAVALGAMDGAQDDANFGFWDFGNYIMAGADKIAWNGVMWVLLGDPIEVTAGKPGAWVPPTHPSVPAHLLVAIALGAMPGAVAGTPWAADEYVLATDGAKITWDGATWKNLPPPFSVTPGTPGAWVPPNDAKVPADMWAAAGSLGAIPGAVSGTPWGPKERVLAADNAPITWDGSRWVDWIAPLAVTRGRPGSWTPAGHPDIPNHEGQAGALTGVGGTTAGTPWPPGDWVEAVNGDAVTWNGTKFVFAVTVKAGTVKSGSAPTGVSAWYPPNQSDIPANLAAARAIGSMPGATDGAAWDSGARVETTDGTLIHWNGASWSDWVIPLSVTLGSPGQWAPPNHSDIPDDLAGANSMLSYTSVENAIPGAAWVGNWVLAKNGDAITWDGTKFVALLSVKQGSSSSQPWKWDPASQTPANLTALRALGLMPGAEYLTPWPKGAYAVLGDGDKTSWSGASWNSGPAGDPTMFAKPGKPGAWSPSNHPDVPADLAALKAYTTAKGNINGADVYVPWKTGEYIDVGGSHVFWDGHNWIAGVAP